MQFRIPPSLITAVSGAGYRLGLLANNHAGDAGSQGYITTREVLTENGMDFIGTRGAVADKRYLVKDVGGIKIGLVNYTYGQDTSSNSLINRFSDSNLELFYTDMQRQIADMKADGAEAIVLYIHWGYEYFLTPNRNQTAVAEKMCELGVDVIIGGHPHKIQPLELITADNGNQAVCLYSMGNFLSNQVIESMYGGNRSNSRNFQDHVSCPIPDVSNRYNDDKWDQHVKDCNDNGHTEDGLLFQTTFTKYSDGVVRLTGVDVLPTWCYRYKDSASGSGFGYKVVPLDKSVENWGSAFGIPDIDLTYANRSYDRTMKLVGDGLAPAARLSKRRAAGSHTAMPSRRLPRRILPARPLDRHIQGTPPLEDVVFQRGCFYWDADAGGSVRDISGRLSSGVRTESGREHPLSPNRRLNARLAAAVKIRGVETAEGRPAPFQSAAQIKYRSSGKRSLTLRWHPSRTSRPSRAIFPASRYKRTPVS